MVWRRGGVFVALKCGAVSTSRQGSASACGGGEGPFGEREEGAKHHLPLPLFRPRLNVLNNHTTAHTAIGSSLRRQSRGMAACGFCSVVVVWASKS